MDIEDQEVADIEDSSDSSAVNEDGENYEDAARNLGWTPEDEFQGDPDKWIDAKEFVDRGQHMMPILKANNRRLQRELSSRDTKMSALQKKVEESDRALQALEKHYTEANKRAVENAKLQLKEELREARASGDVDEELGILDKLEELRGSDKPDKSEEPDNTGEPAADPAFEQWLQSNDWFGIDRKKTKAITRIAEDLRDDGDTTVGIDFYVKCEQILNRQTQKRNNPGKVEGVTGIHSTTTSGKSFNSLPQDAKDACLSDVDVLVGPGKRYKNTDEWKSAYAKMYYGEQ